MTGGKQWRAPLVVVGEWTAPRIWWGAVRDWTELDEAIGLAGSDLRGDIAYVAARSREQLAEHVSRARADWRAR